MRACMQNVALAATALLCAVPPIAAIDLDLQDTNSIKEAASTIAHGMMTWYPGNLTGGIPGEFGGPYYWWEAGAAMGALIDYWYYTGDDTYNDVVSQALLFQASPTLDYMPANQTTDEGNDDQVFWGFAVMTAAEYKFPNPSPDDPQWLALAQGVWNSMQRRWDTDSCNGGLRWQIFVWNLGYGYKNSPSNAGFLNLGARLYAYTRNETYREWVEKTWDWMVDVKLISDGGTAPGYSVYDGTVVTNNCSTVSDFVQWTYSAGMLLNSAAVMFNVTGDTQWETRVTGLWQASDLFFYDSQILWEQACERPGGDCDLNEFSFKSYFARYMAASTKWMPALYAEFEPYFQYGAVAAAKQCTGTIAGLYNAACGFTWTNGGTWDGTYGLGQQLDAMQMILTNMVQDAGYPVTAHTGGISKGDPSAGTGGDTSSLTSNLSVIDNASRAGAGVLTAFVVVAWLGAIWWMFV